MKNIDVLEYGIQHIAKNHNFTSYTDWKEDGSLVIMGNNIPTLCDVEMLCEDLNIDKSYIFSNDFCIEVEIPYEWFETEKDKNFIGLRMWERKI